MSTDIRPAWADKQIMEAHCEIIRVPESEYNATRHEWISAHSLEDFREGPDYYQATLSGLITKADSPAMAFGRAAHCLILEGDEVYRERYLVTDGPINEKTGKPFGRDTKAFGVYLDEIRKTGKEPITHEEHLHIATMRDNVFAHVEASRLLRLCSTEVVVTAQIDGLNLRGRLDAVSFSHRVIVDLKTTEKIDRFQWDFLDRGYSRQLAFYRMLTEAATGHEIFDVFVIVVDKTPLHRVRLYRVTPETLTKAMAEIKDLLDEFKQCQESGSWTDRLGSVILPI